MGFFKILKINCDNECVKINTNTLTAVGHTGATEYHHNVEIEMCVIPAALSYLSDYSWENFLL